MPNESPQERFARSLEILQELRLLPEHERPARLDELCAGDDEMHAEVASLLAVSEPADEFLEGAAPGAKLRQEVETRPGKAPEASVAPLNIGPYRLLRVLGEGGMGSVYEAEQAKPRRRVALKLLRAGLGSKASCLRFEREAEFLGQLSHPGIAQVIESGIHRDERGGVIPWIAMELIDGETITRHAKESGLSQHERIGLVIQACDAVAHAHARGIVHRDLKPDNMLVDAAGRVRVLDFGVARAIDGPDLELSRLTMAGDIVGTLSYMSPEQAGGRPEDVDERSDVYSLGVLAHELLSGRLPHDLKGLALADALGRIRDTDADRLSLGESGVKDDLGVIVAKALEKEPKRRYDTVADLGADLRRYLRHEPIEARAPSAVYRITRFARRNRVFVASVLGIMITLAVAVVATSRLAVDALEGEQEALRAQYRSHLAAARAAATAGDVFAAGRFLADAPEAFRGWEWRQLHASLDESLSQWQNPPGDHLDIAFHADSGTVVTARTEDIQSVDPVSGEVLWTYRAESSGQVLALSPTGRHAVLGKDSSAILLPIGESRATHLEISKADHAGFSPDGKLAWIRSIGPGGELKLTIVNAATGTIRSSLTPLREHQVGFGLTASAVTHHADGAGLLVWDLVFDSQPRVLGGALVLGSTVSQRGRRAASAMRNTGRTAAWDLMQERALAWHDTGPRLPAVQQLMWSANEDRLLVVHADGIARLLDGATGRLIALVSRSDLAGFYCAPAFDNAHHRLAVVDAHDEIAVLDIADGQVLRRFKGHGRALRGLAFREDGELLASVDDDGQVRVWDTDSLDAGTTLRGHEKYVYEVALSPDDQRIASGSWDGTVRVWDRATSDSLAVLRPQPIVPYYGKLAWSPDSRRLATVHGHVVTSWDMRTGEQLGRSELVGELGGPTQSNESLGVAWHPSGDFFAVGAKLRPLHVYSIGADRKMGGPELWPIEGEALDFSPDGRLLALTENGSVQLWDVQSKQLRADHPAGSSRLRTVAFSPDGMRLAAVSDDSYLFVWSVLDGRLLLEVRAHRDQVHGLAWSPDGSRLATGGSDHVIRIWHSESGEELSSLPGHERYAYTLDWSADGELLVSGSGDNTVRLWDAAPARERLLARRERNRIMESVRPRLSELQLEAESADAWVALVDAESGWSEDERRVAMDLVLQHQSGRASH